MKRHLLVAVVVAFAASALPAVASAKAPKVAGVVVARESARGTLVVASAHGVVHTLRTTSHARVGSRVRAAVTRLADGTYRATSVRTAGKAQRARVHGTVVTVAARRLVLSAGGSVFSVNRARSSAAVGGSGDVQPGDVVNATVSIDSQSGDIQESGVQTVGTSSLVQLEGTIQSLDASTLVLAVEEGPVTTIAIPSSLTLPSTIAVGDRVEVSTDYSAGTFALVTLLDDHAAAAGASGSSEDQNGGVEAEGIVSAVDATSLTVQTEHGAAMTFTVPSGVDVSGVAVGDRVHAKGQLQSDGTMTLVQVHVQQPEQSDGGVKAEGTVTALDSSSLTITTEHGTAVTFTVPSGFDLGGLAVGDTAEAQGTQNADGSITLVQVEKKGSSSGGSGDSGGSGSGSGGDSGGSGSGSGSGSGGDG